MLSEVLLGVIIFLVIVVITFIAMIFWPKPKCFFSHKKYYPFLSSIEKTEIHKQITEEVKKFLERESEYKNICGSKDISIYSIFSESENKLMDFPILSWHIAPGIQEQKIKRIYVCVLGADAKTKHENTAAKLSNDTLRALFLTEPFGGCKIWCDGETKILNSAVICYDHSRENFIQNEDFYSRTSFIIFDLERPKELPVGISKTPGECPLC